jgi:GTP cyclohydrolase I
MCDKRAGTSSFTEDDVARLLRTFVPDHDRSGLTETPARVIAAWLEWTAGYHIDPAAILKTFDDGAEGVDELVFQGAIPVWSLCEHHLAPFFGLAHIGYVPNKRVVGLSKLARLTDVFARRLQIQERLTVQIADALVEHLEPIGVGVVLQCRHTCIESRGVKSRGSVTITSALRGCFRSEKDARAEFMSMVHTCSQGLSPV